MEKVRVGIIGLGGMANVHCEAIATVEQVELVAVADLLPEKRREFMDEYGVPRSYGSHEELLRDDEIDAVAVTLGHHLHHRLTVDACNAGKHVLVEKPMAINLEQCDDMVAAAAANGVKLMLGYTQHFYATSMKAKEILDSGELGPIITAVACMCKNWGFSARPPQYRSRFHGGGMWMTNGVHVVDRLTWMMASQAVSVSAAIGTRAHYQASDDSATAFIRYKNGLSGVAVTVGYQDGGPTYENHVICANGSLKFSEHFEKYVRVGKGERWEDVPFDEPPHDLHHEWRTFAEAIQQDIEPPTHGEYGRHIMEIVFAAEQSAIIGREVMLEGGASWATQSSGMVTTREHGWM